MLPVGHFHEESYAFSSGPKFNPNKKSIGRSASKQQLSPLHSGRFFVRRGGIRMTGLRNSRTIGGPVLLLLWEFSLVLVLLLFSC